MDFLLCGIGGYFPVQDIFWKPTVDPDHWTGFYRFLASEIPLGISLVPVTQA